MSPHVNEPYPMTIEPASSAAAAGAVTDKKPGMFTRMRADHRAKAAGRDEFETVAMRAAAGDVAAVAALPAAAHLAIRRLPSHHQSDPADTEDQDATLTPSA
jgi:hypothetical protein